MCPLLYPMTWEPLASGAFLLYSQPHMQKSHLYSIAALLLLAPAMVSCTVTYGNTDIVTAKEKLAAMSPGKTTKNDVFEAFGQPSDVVPLDHDKGSCWIYRFRKASNNTIAYLPMGVGLVAGGKNGDVYTRLFDFNRKNILTDTRAVSKELYTSNLFSLGRTINNLWSTNDSQKRVHEEMKRLDKPFDESRGSEDQLLENAL